MEPFLFASSSSLDIPVSVKINSLEGYREPLPYSTLLKNPKLRFRGSNTGPYSDLYVCVQLWADSKPLTVRVQTAYKAFKNSRTWNEWLTLPIKYSEIPLSTQLAITVWDVAPGCPEWPSHAIPFGGTTIPLFEPDSTLRRGRQRCDLHLDRVADGLDCSNTPHSPIESRKGEPGFHKQVTELREKNEEMDRLEILMKKHEMGEIPENKWLDQLTFRQIEKLERTSFWRSRARNSSELGTGGKGKAEKGSEDRKDDLFYLYIDFPRFDHPIVFSELEYSSPKGSAALPTSHQYPTPSDNKTKSSLKASGGSSYLEAEQVLEDGEGRLLRIYDPAVMIRDNPAESKHRQLVRSHRTSPMDRDMRPNAKNRDELNAVISYGPTQELNSEEKDLVWKFRYYLTRDKRALTKFVKSVAWTDANEARQAIQMLPKWTEIDIEDALELLGPTFDHPAVRSYAVDRLRKSDDEELLLYLLQLVQALKFDRVRGEGEEEEKHTEASDSSLARFLISRATKNFFLGNYLYWYLMVECDDRSSLQEHEHRKLFSKVAYDFMTELVRQPGGVEIRKTLLRQGELIATVTKLSNDIRSSRQDRLQKIERLKKLVGDTRNELAQINPPLPLPLDPAVLVVGCCAEESSIFKSSLLPLRLTFLTVEGPKYQLLFKTGDDLRQDQLVIQIITLMDRLLMKENLDLKLTPYRILATSTSAGAVQFIQSTPLAQVVNKHRSILGYLQANNSDSNAPLGVRPVAMDTYIKSCAGYSVITYLLGVGDRHLDNLLLSPSGRFFHADFGFILGRDPKPFAPLMKLPREMIDGMGGVMHRHYQVFKQYCFTAYTTLRKSANLILNLFALMTSANIPDIRIEPDKAVFKVQDRFHLELTEEEAIRHFEALITDSVNALIPVVIDRLHGFVQNWRG